MCSSDLAPGWALNAQKGCQLGVKRQNECHSGRLTPERWGGPQFRFQLRFFQTFLFFPIFFYKNTFQSLIIHFQTFKNLKSFFKSSKSFPNFAQKLTLLSISFHISANLLSNFSFFSKISPPHSIFERASPLLPHTIRISSSSLSLFSSSFSFCLRTSKTSKFGVLFRDH